MMRILVRMDGHWCVFWNVVKSGAEKNWGSKSIPFNTPLLFYHDVGLYYISFSRTTDY